MFREMEIFVIHVFDYLELSHKRVCILSLSSNTKDLNIQVQKKFRITLPRPEVRKSVALVRKGLFNTRFSLCLLLWPKYFFLPRSKEFNWSYVLWSYVHLIRLYTKLKAAQGSCAIGLTGIKNVTLKWLRISSSNILCQYAQWHYNFA